MSHAAKAITITVLAFAGGVAVWLGLAFVSSGLVQQADDRVTQQLRIGVWRRSVRRVRRTPSRPGPDSGTPPVMV